MNPIDELRADVLRAFEPVMKRIGPVGFLIIGIVGALLVGYSVIMTVLTWGQ